MKVRFTRQALNDLEDIAGYIRERNPAAASRVRASLLLSLRDLAEFPEIGRRQNVSGVRKYMTRRYSYAVYYTTDDETVIVLTIRHSARERQYKDA